VVIREADAVVVGAGSFGASIAYHLAKLGRRVALVDKHDLVSQTSPRAAGLTLQLRSNPVLLGLARRSVEKIENLTEETGEPLSFHRSGSITLTREERLVGRIHAEVAQAKEAGLEAEVISPSEAHDLAPFLEPERARAIAYVPSDLFLEPGDLPRAYVRAAENLGASLMPHTAVESFVVRDGSVGGVVTDGGEIRAPVVVDAAGAWTGALAEAAGFRAPLVPTRHQLYITKPIAGVSAEQPIVRVLDANVYVRPERGGLLLGGYEPDPVQVDARTLSPDFHMERLALDFEPLRELTREVADEFPALQDAEIDELRGGLPTMTADGRFIIDHAPGVAGFFLASGCCVGGLSNSPAVGELVAEWAVNGKAPADASLFGLSRFGPEFESEERLREACHWLYANKYTR
jgi:glycine/D-amino acid oxidase-like deaminating enzyme